MPKFETPYPGATFPCPAVKAKGEAPFFLKSQASPLKPN